MNVEEIATALRYDDEGYWVAAAGAPVSYPEDGNDFCMSIEERSFWFGHRNRIIVAAVNRYPPFAGTPLFDVGAGNGFVSAALSAEGFRVAAIEPNTSGARNAARRGLDPVICGTLPSPAFRERSAGAIGLFDVLEHNRFDRDFLVSLRPYLLPGGRIYLTVPAYAALWSGDDVAAGHLRRYSVASLRQTVEMAGFEVEYATYFFCWLPLPILALRAIPYRLGRRRAAPSKGEHTAGGTLSRSILLRALAFETRLISRGVSMPFGGSCLAVARVAPAVPQDRRGGSLTS